MATTATHELAPLVPAAYITRTGRVRWMLIPDEPVTAPILTGMVSLDAALRARRRLLADAFDMAPCGYWRA